MIKAKFFRDDNQQITRFTITGHADSGEYGKDIVCAAVSATSIGTVNSLVSLSKLTPDVNADEKNGGLLDVQIPTPQTELQGHDSQLLLENLLNTLMDIQKSYAQYVKIIQI